MNIKISSVSNKKEACKIDYTIEGSKRSITSDQVLTPEFIKTMEKCVPVALRMCDLDPKLQGFTLSGISIQRKETADGENKSIVLSIKKPVKSGTLNISTPKRWLECESDNADVLDDISQNTIQELCSHASFFVKNDSINRTLYSQAELSLTEEAAMETAAAES